MLINLNQLISQINLKMAENGRRRDLQLQI